jgi:DNA adenine methylase
VSDPGNTARPIVKWVGGKTKLLPELLARIPIGYGRYYEPFTGGAALFFRLQPERAVLGDANADLIAMYETVRDNVEHVIRELAAHQVQHSEQHYYATRDMWNDRLYKATAVQRAAAFIYLNKTCFNGLYRVNRKGAFNVPVGSYASPTICDADGIRAASVALARAELRTGDYRDCVHDAREGDFVYFDPPYDETFNGYTSAGKFDQATLAAVARELVNRGCHVLLSNSDTPWVRELYADFDIADVVAPRFVNSDATGRAGIVELLIASRTRQQLSLFQEVA